MFSNESLLCNYLYACFVIVVYVERKRLRAEFRRQYPGVTDSQLTMMFGSNEDLTSMKINTHGGQDTFIYFVQRNPAFFEYDKIIYPTGLLTSTSYLYFVHRYIFLLLCLTTYTVHCD